MITLIKHPKRRAGLTVALVISLVAHAVWVGFVYVAPIFGLAMNLSGIEYVDEAYDRSILITFSKPLKYPSGYLGFSPPERVKSLEEIKEEEARRAKREAVKREAERRRREQERLARERAEAAQRKAEAQAAELAEAESKTEDKSQLEEQAKAEELAKTQATPTPRPDGYGSFGKINTAPIKDQVQRLYEAKKAGKLEIPDGKFKVGVTGSVNADGTLADYRVNVPSGIAEIDRAALAVLKAVSESRALGPLHQLNALTLVLEIDQVAQLVATGHTDKEQDAINITNLAQAALLVARFKKGDDATSMILLNNLKVTRTGARIQAVITVPRQLASDTLTKTMTKGQPPPSANAVPPEQREVEQD